VLFESDWGGHDVSFFSSVVLFVPRTVDFGPSPPKLNFCR
jgi:hypothetical protein